MNVQITGHQISITASIKEYILQKFVKIQRHYSQNIHVHVVLEVNKLNKKIVVAPFALAKTSKKVNLHISKFGLGSSSMIKNTSSLETIRVKQKTLKKALKELNEIKADIVKIDIEGFEDKVLFPYLSVLQKDYLPSLIIIEDNSADWDFNILDWLEKNYYKRVGETRGNIFLVKN